MAEAFVDFAPEVAVFERFGGTGAQSGWAMAEGIRDGGSTFGVGLVFHGGLGSVIGKGKPARGRQGSSAARAPLLGFEMPPVTGRIPGAGYGKFRGSGKPDRGRWSQIHHGGRLDWIEWMTHIKWFSSRRTSI
jgi:hypothetical protein